MNSNMCISPDLPPEALNGPRGGLPVVWAHDDLRLRELELCTFDVLLVVIDEHDGEGVALGLVLQALSAKSAAHGEV